MEKNINKKNAMIALIIIIIVLVSVSSIFLILKKIENDKNNIDISDSIHGVVIKDKVGFYKKPKKSKWKYIKEIDLGENAYIVEDILDKNNKSWYKVKIGNKVGYVEKENISYYEFCNDDEYVLMSDVSKFNIIFEHFESKEEYEAFLLNSNINYVYIRAGGRGYGEEGNFYTDPKFKIFIEACEYLGIPYGFYYIDEAITSEEVDEEVEFIKKFLEENKTSLCVLPLVIDVENHDGVGRADEIWDDRAKLVTELTIKFKENDIETIVYSNANLANEYLYNMDTNFWIAYYNLEGKIPSYWYTETEQKATENIEFTNKIVGWQFTEKGIKKFPEYPVDLSLVNNKFFRQYVKNVLGEK